MKRLLNILVAITMMVPMVTMGAAPVEVSNLSLQGEIEGENIIFTLKLTADVAQKGVTLPLVIGDVAFLDGKLPAKSELVREGNRYALKFGTGRGFWGSASGKQDIEFRFASRAAKQVDWRSTAFSIPSANIRKLSVLCDRHDLKIEFPGALDVKRQKVKREGDKEERTQVTAFLGIAGAFQVRWKPEVKRLDSELVVSCDANTIATASVGALRLNTIFTYRVIQGSFQKLSMALPDVNVTQVSGDNIQDWKIDKTDKVSPKLIVTLARPQEGVYRMQVDSEMILPKFPSSFDLPVVAPEGVIRTSGHLLIGTDSAIKMQVTKAGGLTQIDQASFPTVMMTKEARPRPTKSTYAYQYANTPYTLSINADDIVTAFSADDRLVLSLTDNELVFDASIEIDVKDAPAREIMIETDPDPEWTVTSITGRQISEADADVREENGKRIIYVPFKQAVRGVAVINIRMEKTLKASEASFKAPKFEVLGARSERGYLVLSSEKGVRLNAEKDLTGLQEVHTGSAPMKVVNAQQAFRFKKPGWSVTMKIDRTLSTIYSEVFHLVSLGEGMLYSSAAITYHIDGAPVQEFKIKVPQEAIANADGKERVAAQVEFTGADIEGWKKEGDIYTVKLHTKIIGDYSLLVSYDKQFNYGKDTISAGGVETVGIESEMGYIAIVSSLSLDLSRAKGLTYIEQDEIPAEYASSIADPIIAAYKYVKNPHAADITVEPYDTDQLLGQVADYVKLNTVVSRDGESKTTVTYYIKNTAEQYLMVRPPQGVDTTYSIVLVAENGKRERVSAQTDEKGNLLIPVRRPRDPNTPIRVELVYAMDHGELGFWRSGVKGVTLYAPTLPKTHATVASWNIEVKTDDKDRYVIEQSNGAELGGLPGALQKAWWLTRALLDGPRDITVNNVMKLGWGGAAVKQSTRTVNLSGAGTLSVNIRVVPEWMGSVSSVRSFTIYCLVGMAILLVGMIAIRKRAVCVLGLTVLAFGVSHCAVGRSVLAWVTILLALFLMKLLGIFKLLGWILKGIFRGIAGMGRHAGEARQARRERREERAAMMQTIPEPAYADGPSGGLDPFEPLVSDDSGQMTDDRPVEERSDEDRDGYVTMRMLGAVLAIGLAASVAVAAKAPTKKPAAKGRPVVQKQVRVQPPPAPVVPVMDVMTVDIVGPGTGREVEQSATVTAVLEFHADHPTSFVVVPSTCVLKEYNLNSRNLAIKATGSGYVLSVKKKGTYKVTLEYQSPVKQDQAGQWALAVSMLSNMKNKVSLRIPEVGLDIESPEGVLFKIMDLKDATQAEAVFGPIDIANFRWRPRARKTELEDAVFFCEVNSYMALRSGVVDLANVIRYQIAQGEVKELKVKVPKGMSVTAVRAAGLATWSFDPETQLLDAILEKAVTGDFVLTVVTQIAREGLPYSATVSVPQVLDASRQRGAIALAAPDTVQVKVDDKAIKGLHPMNIEDFPAATSTQGKRGPSAMTIRKAFRYHQAEEVAVTVATERVLSEIRVMETGILDISDERIKLATKLQLAIAKSGIFSIELGIPEGYDVETLSGKDVSHWDELGPDAGMRGVTVHFTRQVSDATELDLVVARMEKEIEEHITVPRVTVRDARKHKGRLTITGERGVRMMVENHRGVDILKASEEGIRQAGVLLFDILRPTWSIDLKTEVLKALVKPEVLQWVDLTEGMLQCTTYLQYKVENAGVKSFYLMSPKPGVKISVTGTKVARVTEIDKTQGIWQIDMHSKVEKQTLTVKYQIPYIPEEKTALIRPLSPMDVDAAGNTVAITPQSGFLVLTCRGRVQVTPQLATGLKAENPRNIPRSFKAGDLSSAILCYRTVRADYGLGLSVVRHDAANVLPAHVKQVRLTSVTSSTDALLTRVVLRMTVGNLRHLQIQLPNPTDKLWTIQVNGKEVNTARDGKNYLVPLEELGGDQVTGVDLIYSGSAGKSLGSRQNFNVPQFGYKDAAQKDKLLPLDDIEWVFYVDPAFTYYAFDGSMRNIEEDQEIIQVFNATAYLQQSEQERDQSVEMAKKAMDIGERLVQAGKPQMAQKLFEQATTLSQGEATLNEDARVQLRNVKVQQAKIGLANRRNVVRWNANVIDEEQIRQMEGFQSGNFTQEYASGVERGLSAKDNDALDALANKMLDQQTAAAGVVTAIRVIMPHHGRVLKFSRTMSTQPGADLNVQFKMSSGRMAQWMGELGSAAIVFLVLWAMMWGAAVKRGVKIVA